MSIATTDHNLPAVPDDDSMAGLEDLDQSDLVMPRLKIVHDEAVFEDNLTNEKFVKLEVVALGIIKQRVLWDADDDDFDSPPLCKSYDHEVGYADPESFPWDASAFDKKAFDADEPVLPCNACPLKEWDSHPTRGTPWCTEQHTIPVLIVRAWVAGETEPVAGHLAPAIVTFQRSAMKASKAYASSFLRAKMPMFTALTTITLEAQKKGTTKYATPALTKGSATDETEWPEWATQVRQIRAFLQTPRKRDANDEDGTPVADPAPAATETTATEAAPAAAPAQTPPDDDIPF